MTRYDIGVLGAQVALPDGLRRVDLGLRGGRFAAVETGIDPPDCGDVVDATGLTALPGIFDAHNHPYYDDDLVEFASSAAYGGITTLLSFAGTHMAHVPAVPPSAIDVATDFIAQAANLVPLDYGVHSIVGPGDDPDSTVGRLQELGITSVKMFLAFPGRRMLDDATVLTFMQAAARRGMLCMVHCENGPATTLLERQAIEHGRNLPLDYAASRPATLESEAVYRALALAEIAGVACYLVHLSCAQSLDVVETFRARANIPIWVETCPHYLLLDESDLDRLGGLAKISPPLRTSSDAEILWQAVGDGVVNVIASDCSGQKREPKQVADIFAAPYGIPGVEHMLPLMWQHIVNERKFGPGVLAERMSRAPADIFGVAGKGRIEVGRDADLVLIDPELTWAVRAADQHGNSDYSLYEGSQLRGRPVHTIRRGQHLLRDGELSADIDAGIYLSR